MTTGTTLAQIKNIHHQLYDDQFFGEKLKNREVILENDDRRKRFIKDVDKLLQDINEISEKITSAADYSWLTGAAMKWQEAFSILHLPRNVELPKPPAELKPAQPSVKLMSDNEVANWIADKAYHIAKDRKERLMAKITELPNRRDLLEQIVSDPNRMLEILGEAPEHVRSRLDWFDANTHFATYVLDSTIHLTRQLTPKSYWRLEQQWVDEVKQLKAYFIWLNRCGPIDPGQQQTDYWRACDDIYRRLTDQDIKLPLDEFRDLGDYISTRYLEDSEAREQLIRRKAHRLVETTGERDAEKNWRLAEDFVTAFYDNILDAVRNSTSTSVTAVLEALKGTSPAISSIVNSFEMALAIYFLPSEAPDNS